MVPVNYVPEGPASPLERLLLEATEEALFLADPRHKLQLKTFALERMVEAMGASGAGIVFADSADVARIDYQTGSVRDDFEFGPLIAVSVPRARESLERHGPLDRNLQWGAMYDLRLKLSADFPIFRVPETLYTAEDPDMRSSGDRLFDYLDASRTDYQDEMEMVLTAHLKRIGAYLPRREAPIPPVEGVFPVKATVVIPVRNREETIGDALESALAQETDFPFNIIVVDNHSKDSTAGVIESFGDPRLVRKVPERHDLGIGGCWNEAIFSPECGRFALQLDSDDLFPDSKVVARIVQEMELNHYAMLAGSYTTVDFDLNEIAPGLVAHTEWTRDNGHNNLLRVNGVGAPRAYDVSVIRRFGFPNVSYGEDYAMGLRVSREFEIGRIYDSLYLCRRWTDNTDAEVSQELSNLRNIYKDGLRTREIQARIEMSRDGEQ